MVKPWKVSNAGVAFGATGPNLPTLQECNRMYDEGKIPERYQRLVSDWFFSGLSSLTVEPREGIDKEEAMMCIRAELGSWSRKHEHKTALIAWLFDQWFSDVQWTVKEKK
jgi:hypothetical protein